MPEHAARLPLSKRLLKPAAIAAVILLGALGMTEGQTSAAKAAALLSCDQNTVYAITGSNGTVQGINVSNGSTTALPSFGTANNALAIAPNGTAAYATVNQAAANTAGAITKYDAATGNVTTESPVSIPGNTFRGAINPLNSYYYYAQGGVSDPAVYAYDTINKTPIGLVGHLPAVTAGNGDFAFSTTGQLYLAAGAQVLRVDTAIPTTAGNVSLATSQVTALPSGTNSPGIAFSTSGYLYVASGTSLLKIDPSSGANMGTVAIAGNIQPSDLASCNYADSVSAKASVNERWQSTDQFGLEVDGDGLLYGNTATTSGTATGLQKAIAGASLVVAGQTYTAKETAKGTTDLANYDTSYVCTTKTVDGTTTQTQPTQGTSASITLAANSADADVSCVFTNTLKAVHSVAVADSFHTPTGTTLTVPAAGVLANDTVGTGNTVAVSSQPSNGSLTFDTATGAFTYVPADGFAGTDTFTYTDTDSSGTASTATVTIVVGPTAVDDSATIGADDTLAVDSDHGVLANDKGTGLTAVKASDPSHGSVTVNPDGSYTYEPTANFSGQDSFTYTVTDSGTDSATGTVTITVTPKAVADTLPSTTINQTAEIPASTLTGNDRGTGLTITAVGPAATGTVSLSSDGSSITYVPKPRTSGIDTFTYTVTDASGTTSTATETIRIAPTAADDTLPSTPAGAPETITSATLLGNDRGTGLSVTGVSSASNGTVALSTDGTEVVFTPADGFSGPAQFTYEVTDSSGGTATAVGRLTVEPEVGANAMTAVSGQELSVSKEDGVLSDSSGSGLQASLETGPRHGDLTLNTDGSYTYTSDPAFSGTDTFTYTVTDSSNGTTTGTVTITVVPSAKDDTVTPTDAGVTERIAAADLTGNDSGSTLTVAGITQGQHGRVTLNSDGTVSYRPHTGWSGTDTFTYTVTDGSTVSEPATVTIATTPVAVDDTVPNATVGTDSVIPAADLTTNDKGTGLTITSVQNPSLGSVSLDSDGDVVYSPTPGFSGIYTFDYTVTDGSGQKSTATATITVAPSAGPLTATPTAATTDTVAADDGLLSQADGSGLSVAIASQPDNGTVTLVGTDGGYTYVPAPGYSGPDSFTYTVTDGSGTSTTGTVTVTVLPKAVDDTATALSGVDTAITTASLTGNDKGTDLKVTGVTQPTGGAVVDSGDGTLTFTADPTFSGTTTFTYTVSDPAGGTATATVTVQVAPVAKADSGTTPAGTKLTVAKADGLLANDSGAGLTAALATSAAHGTAAVASDGSWTYQPTGSFSGTDSFTYSATDSSGTIRTATVKVTVTPKAVADAYTTAAGVPVHRDAKGVLANDIGSTLTVTGVATTTSAGSVVTTPAGGTVTIKADGTFDYTPAAGFSGADTFPYAITDGSHQTVAANVVVTVTPVAVDDAFETGAGTPLAIGATDLTGDDLGTHLAVTATGTPKHGTLVPATSGFTYTPADGFSGTDSFTYTVTDSSGQAATATARILVGVRAADYAAGTDAGTSVKKSAQNGLLKDDSGTKLVATLDQAPTHGTVTVDPDGAYVYIPARGFSGTDSFTYTVTDDSGQVRTGVVTITVTPLAAPNSEKTKAGRQLVVGGSGGILGNDSGSGLVVTGVTTPSHGGTAVISGAGVLTYTPATGFSGTETFDYTVTDTSGQTATTTVTVTVLPNAAADSGATTMGRRLAVTAAEGLLSDDLGTGLTAALKSAPHHGTVAVRPDGSYTYVPKAGFTGVDTFTYTATDASGHSTTATATITVAPGASAADDAITGKPNHAVTVNLLANDNPTSGATFDPSSIGLLDPATGHVVQSLEIAGKGTFRVVDSTVTFAPEHNFHGETQIRYRVADSDGVYVSAVIRVTYPTVVAAAISGSAGAVASSLAFTGSTGTGLTLTVGAAAMLLGLGLIAARRLRRPAPGPRRTGV
ncbi:CshA-type fibril repeat protein [Frondihabitans sp. PhB188]|uniref:Ig-like domain-containing protein n=1 Tax=Frondihabitans sp. PhB188 TaxID=2485200 RepID=UPI000F4864EA|nr:Ig-like domain-containing protein [Frondihabitans sp. PhB188]ROQ39754.1 CshA-type fibril repeat protein [Frondihabitans sp. PhB188]